MNEESLYSSSNLDHLGLVAGMVDELGLVELIDAVIIQDHEQRVVSVGQCVKAMVLNGLGFVNRSLYLMPHFFKDKPIGRLLGEGIEAEHLNDDTLGRALDTIYAYGAEQLYGQLAAQSVKRLELSCDIGHIDSTSFHVDGDYNSDQEASEQIIHITKGYSRDHRPDLNQVILQLITDNQAGIPLWMEALSGNSNDKESFRKTLNAHLEQLHEGVGLSLVVADSALYTAKTLKDLGDFPWITRVPETIGGTRELILAVSDEWMIAQPERAYTVLGATYGGVKQRWLVVYTQGARERAEQTVDRQHLKKSEVDYKAFSALAKRTFACVADAEAALAALQKKLKFVTLHDSQIVEIKRFKGKGRPQKDSAPDTVGYRVEAGVASMLDMRQRKIQQKSCFIVASNQLDENQLSNEDMLDHYTPGQQKVEHGFRFLKDPWFMANTLFLKSPKRITVLMMIMTICLLVYAALEYRIRQSLQQNEETFPTQIGTTTEKPTARWVFQFFAGIHVLLIDSWREVVLNCNEHHHHLLNLLGERYVHLYADSEYLYADSG
ncbi:MAG: IS1634 family transposase [Methylococcaceae bacterium]